MKLWRHSDEQPPGTAARPSAGHAHQPFRAARADILSVTFTGNTDLRLDNGAMLRAGSQKWTPRHATSALFEGSFCIPILNVEIGVEEALPFPVRMRLTGEADNRMLFSREFTFPAGKHRRIVRDIESDRPTGGVFDAVGCVRWFLESSDLALDIGECRETRFNLYFIPRYAPTEPPQDTVLYTLCRTLKGLPLGHPQSLQRIWDAFENLDIPTADGAAKLACAEPRQAGLSAADLLRHRAGGCEAWVDLFLTCLRLAGSERGTEKPAEAAEPWPWTVAEQDIKVRLLEAKCRHLIRQDEREHTSR